MADMLTEIRRAYLWLNGTGKKMYSCFTTVYCKGNRAAPHDSLSGGSDSRKCAKNQSWICATFLASRKRHCATFFRSYVALHTVTISALCTSIQWVGEEI